ncbi:MAG: type II secretion system F family protein [Candidatus Micrarchaeota archaeon]|nr:type II secretion system F family protein [Candidatus Micrarchaeota archaeon]
MPGIRFERLVSRDLGIKLSRELDLAGVKMEVEKLLRIMIVGAVLLLVFVSFTLYVLGFNVLIDAAGGLGSAAVFILVIYFVLEYKIDARKSQVEEMLPDYLQIVSANLRSGIALDRAMLLAARPEFKFLTEDVKEMNRRIFGGENFDSSLKTFAARYRSYQLSHAIRMILESLKYGGAMADLIEQISKDMRNQQMTQKEVSSQLFMYSIFIAFAGLIAAPVLYGLTAQMIVVTDAVWKGILTQNPGGLPTTGISFLKPSPPQISPTTYHNFSLAAIIIITGFASLIMSAISSGSAIKGLRWLPIFIIIGIVIFIVMQALIGGIFAGIGAGI